MKQFHTTGLVWAKTGGDALAVSRNPTAGQVMGQWDRTGHVTAEHVNTGHVTTGHLNTGHVTAGYIEVYQTTTKPVRTQ